MVHIDARQKVKVKGHSVQKLDWKETDGRDCITSRSDMVGNKVSRGETTCLPLMAFGCVHSLP